MTVQAYNTRLDEMRYPILAETIKYNVDGRKRLVDNPRKVADFMANEVGLKDAAEEYFYAVAFDTKTRLIGLFEVGHGTVRNYLASTREIFMRLVMIGAVNWIAVHNHPSGDATPSETDKKLTETLKQASEVMGIPLLDHIIVGDGEYKSFREEGLM